MEKILPKGWVETELGNISFVQSGGTPSRGNVNYWKGDIPWVKISDIKKMYVDSTEEFITDAGLKNSSARVFPKGTILFTIFATIGKIGVLNIDATTNQAIAGITPIKLINHKYLVYILIELSQSLQDVGKGVAQKNINQAILKSLQIPLPPLPEQERIVAKLDKLFAQHEKIIAALDRIPQLLKNFRQQVLTHAVTGKPISLKDIGVWKGGGTPSKSNKLFWDNGNILWITAKDMKALFIDDSIDKITLEGVNGSSAHLIPVNSILIVTRSGILRRILPISTNQVETTVNQDLKVLIPKKEYYYKYLLYALNGKEEDIRNECMKSGTTVESVEFELLKNYELAIPPLQEQQEIVSRVESLFAKADAIEARYQALKAKIDSLPQAILQKAFNGELVPQLSTDGDAKDLLADILALKKEMKGKKRKE